MRLIFDDEAAGINGWVRVCGLHREHKMSIQGASWTKSQNNKASFAEETFDMVDFARACNQPTAAHLTIESIIAVCSTEVVTASQFDAGVTGDAPVAAVYPERFVGVTVSRECCALASGCRNICHVDL